MLIASWQLQVQPLVYADEFGHSNPPNPFLPHARHLLPCNCIAEGQCRQQLKAFMVAHPGAAAAGAEWGFRFCGQQLMQQPGPALINVTDDDPARQVSKHGRLLLCAGLLHCCCALVESLTLCTRQCSTRATRCSTLLVLSTMRHSGALASSHAVWGA